MNDETQNNNKIDNHNIQDTKASIPTGITNQPQTIETQSSINPNLDNQNNENLNKKIPLFSRQKFGKRLSIIGLILAVLVFIIWFFMDLFFYASYGDSATYPEIKIQSSLGMVVVIIFCLCLIVLAFGFIVNYKSYKYTMNKNKLKYLYPITSVILLVFALIGIIMSSMSIIHNATETIPKPKNESAVLKALQSVSNNDIVSINILKTEEPQYKDGYIYSGTYHLKGLNAEIDFSYYDRKLPDYGISWFIIDDSISDDSPYKEGSYDSPYKAVPYFKNFALYKTYFKDDDRWNSFENFYNQTGETKLGMIDRAIDLEDNKNNEIDLPTTLNCDTTRSFYFVCN